MSVDIVTVVKVIENIIRSFIVLVIIFLRLSEIEYVIVISKRGVQEKL